MKITKIDWCDCTVNPVVGCPNGCKYCYGRVMNSRFGFVPCWDKPEFRPEQLKQFKSKTPKSVFIDSMSDIGTWKDEWLKAVIEAIRINNQHWYISLTKTDTRRLIDRIMKFQGDNREPLKLFIGKSITTQEQADAIAKNTEITDFLSVEPLLEPIDMSKVIFTTQAVIIGAETGRRKGKVIPQKKWVKDIVEQADLLGITVFMKESLRKIMSDDFRQDALPWFIGKTQEVERMKEVAYIGRKEDFCRRFEIRSGQGIYIDKKTNTKCICVCTERDAIGRRFDDAIINSDGDNYYRLYGHIKATRIKNTN